MAVRRRRGIHCPVVRPDHDSHRRNLLDPQATRPVTHLTHDLLDRGARPKYLCSPAAETAMKFLVMIYNDDSLLDALPVGEADSMMRGCLAHADELRGDGVLVDSQQLESPKTAKTVRIRNGRTSVLDGPFAETKEYLGGFNLIEADSMEDAVRIASEFPWANTGCIEVRPVRDMNAVRRRVGT